MATKVTKAKRDRRKRAAIGRATRVALARAAQRKRKARARKKAPTRVVDIAELLKSGSGVHRRGGSLLVTARRASVAPQVGEVWGCERNANVSALTADDRGRATRGLSMLQPAVDTGECLARTGCKVLILAEVSGKDDARFVLGMKIDDGDVPRSEVPQFILFSLPLGFEEHALLQVARPWRLCERFPSETVTRPGLVALARLA